MTNRGLVLRWLQATDLSKVALTAAIDDHGNLGPVGGLWPKLAAAAEEAARMGLLQLVGTAENQDDVPEPLKNPDASPLRVVQGKTLEDLLERLYEEDGPRAAVRKYERTACGKLDLLGRRVELEDHYQPLPLLREVKKEDLPHDRPKPQLEAILPHDRPKPQLEAIEATEPDHRGLDLQRWEEEVLGKMVTYEGHELDDVFANFRRLVKDAKSEVPRFVVVGPPGSGKTTLVQKLAHQAAAPSDGEGSRFGGRRLLPARVRLRDWESWAVKPSNPEASLADYLAYLTKDYPAPAPTIGQWRRWLQRGEVLLLLDGLDEIDGKAPAFKAALEAVLRLFPSCPTVMTCRTVSFEQYQRWCDDLPTVFMLGGWDNIQRDAYIRTYPAQHADKYDAEELIEQLNSLPAIRSLAANPLLLSILCFVVDDPQSKVDLPATRGELYDQAVEKLLILFHENERVKVSYPNAAPDPGEKREILERTALELFAGNQRRALTFSGTELGRALNVALGEQGYGEGSAPWANALRADLTQNCGLLRGDAKHGYFFLHLTVHEFLAASALARLVNEGGGWGTTLKLVGIRRSVREWVDKKAWDPRWQEVIGLLAGRLEDPGPLLEMLSNPDPTPTNPAGDDEFRHRLTLAALCLPEIATRFRPSHRDVIGRITAETFGLWWQSEEEETLNLYLHVKRALPALALGGGRVPAQERPDGWLTRCDRSRSDSIPILDRLTNLLQDDNGEVRRAALEAIGNMGSAAATEPNLDRLADLFQDMYETMWGSNRLVAVRVTGALGSAAATKAILDRLADLLQDEEEEMRRVAARAIGALGSAAATESILDHLVELIQDAQDADEYVRFEAVEAVDRLGAVATEVILGRLTDLLEDENATVRGSAVEAVGRLGPRASTEVILGRLVDLLCDSDDGVRYRAAVAVGGLRAGAVTPAILDRLADLLKDAKYYTRKCAAEAVDRLGSVAATDTILGRFIDLLQDENAPLRIAAAKAIRESGSAVAIELVLNDLADFLQDAKWFVRGRAAEAVGRLGSVAATPVTLDRLANLLQDESESVRRAAVEAVDELGPAAATEAFLYRLVHLLRNGHASVRSGAIEAAGALGSAAATDAIHDLLVRLLRSLLVDLRCSAAKAVGKLGSAAATEVILNRLADLLRDPRWRVREAAVKAVGKLGSAAATEAILDCLADLLQDENQYARIAAAQAVDKLGPAAATEAILDCLADLLHNPYKSFVSYAADPKGIHGVVSLVEGLMSEGLRLFAKATDTRSRRPGNHSCGWEARTLVDLSR
jgi:HEAT repeat protein